MSIGTIFKNAFTKKIVHVPITEESTNNHNINQAILNENAELKGQMANLLAEDQKRRNTENDKNEEDEVKRSLTQKKYELDRKTDATYFSFGKFFKKIDKDKKFRDSLFFTSFDRKTRLAKFKDMGLTDNGDLVLLYDDGTADGSTFLKMPRAQDMFQSCGSIVYDLNSGAIPLNLDKEGDWFENPLSYWEGPTIIKDEFGDLKYSKAKKKHFYEFIKEKQVQIDDLYSDLSESEETIGNLNIENADLKRANKALDSQSNVSQKELSKNEEQLSAINKVFSGLTKELAKVRDINMLAEEKLNLLENEISTIMTELETESTKPAFKRAMQLLRDVKTEVVGQQSRLNIPIQPVEVPSGK